MCCVMRAAGKNFDVDTFLKNNSLTPLAVFRQGETKSPSNPCSRINVQSSINIAVSNASFDNIKRQIKDAIIFLTENKADIKRLMRFKGVEGAELDFASHKDGAFLQEVEFTSELVALAGSLGLSIKLSQYPQPRNGKVLQPARPQRRAKGGA